MHRCLRISLRTLFLLLTVTAVWLGLHSIAAKKQQRIGAALVSSGASIAYQYQFDNFDDEDGYSRNNDATPPWLARWIGIDYCSPIVKVSSLHADNPSGIAELSARLPKLRTLAIQECGLTDNDLKAFVGLQHLRGLHLRGTHITDGAVQFLDDLKSLKVLNLDDTSLSPAAIDSLRAALPNTRVHHSKSHGGSF